MHAFLVVVATILVAQLGSGSDRFTGSRNAAAGAPTNTNSGNSATTGTPSANLQLPPSGSSPASGGATSPASNGPYTPAPGFGNPPVGDAPKQPTAGNYQVPPVFPADNAATAPPSGVSKATTMMKEMLLAPRDSKLQGEPVTLMQAISFSRSRGEQTQRVEAYWDLCSSVADYYLGLREQDELRQLAASRQGTNWTDAEKELGVRVNTSMRGARAAQYRLANLMGRGPNNLPLPTDAPHCGSFTTNYDRIFSGRSSPEAQELAALLPLRFAELNDAAAGVARDEEWFKGVAARNDSTDGSAIVRQHKLLALSRRAFVQIVRDYNRRIARYSELAMPGSISAERLAGVLIKRPASTPATRPAPPAPPSTRTSSGIDSGPPPTFKDWEPASRAGTADDSKRDDSVQPASASQTETRQERSLLVPLH